MPVEETMEALYDVVKVGKARYIGASSMWAWRFAKMQHSGPPVEGGFADGEDDVDHGGYLIIR